MTDIHADQASVESTAKAENEPQPTPAGPPPQEERILNMVRSTLVVNPKVKNRELYKRAMEIAPDAVKDLSLRQFHATYRLAASRERAIRNGTIKPRKRKSRPQPSGLDRTRTILVEFAEELAKADTRAELVKVIGSVDGWVAKILEAQRPDNSSVRSEEA